MSKRKPARTIKARSASKIRSKAAGSGQPKGRANSKQARVLALLCGPSAATIATVTRSTGCRRGAQEARAQAGVRRRLKPGTVLVRDYQGQRHTVTVVSDGFDWRGATYPSLSAIARAITGTAWSGPRFFALARGNGVPARRKKNASAREGRDGSQPARGMNTASVPLQTSSQA
jgi:DUF2924 family protein